MWDQESKTENGTKKLRDLVFGLVYCISINHGVGKPLSHNVFVGLVGKIYISFYVYYKLLCNAHERCTYFHLAVFYKIQKTKKAT